MDLEFVQPVRRYKRFFLKPETLILMLTETHWMRFTGCPNDAKAVGFYWDTDRAANVVFIESAEFEPVADGEEVPFVDIKIERGDTWLLN